MRQYPTTPQDLRLIPRVFRVRGHHFELLRQDAEGIGFELDVWRGRVRGQHFWAAEFAVAVGDFAVDGEAVGRERDLTAFFSGLLEGRAGGGEGAGGGGGAAVGFGRGSVVGFWR